MAPLADPDILSRFNAALSNWHVTGYVTAKKVALGWARRNLPDFALKTLGKLMLDALQAGEVPDQVRETRPEWNDWDYHYDFRLTWADRDIYVETILVDDDPTDPTIYIVSIHDA
jgi:hypothetical protein